MDIRELRIGNLIRGEEIGEVLKIDIRHSRKKGIIITSEESGMADEFSPIPLTEEWFLKSKPKLTNLVGFDKSYRGKYYSFLIIGIRFLYFTESNSIEKDGAERVWNTVHDFQNLFHSLTGNELEIK